MKTICGSPDCEGCLFRYTPEYCKAIAELKEFEKHNPIPVKQYPEDVPASSVTMWLKRRKE